MEGNNDPLLVDGVCFCYCWGRIDEDTERKQRKKVCRYFVQIHHLSVNESFIK
ncbi:hypothetical protein QY97_00956 [Bacillus thermotolerans]|uniref:Uncharacterized protein n=1 Tax=Bacillus thermotolerans TaxID=1221996 RepID=A0A0F5HUP9_BACTR|nr:hypothetical protein QY97_00956 [Bacillus thermotolerans]KKB40975.1 hypothetical protein QY95_01038 [Bacillus thermotolerans]KKB44958.1 hypothetical protein QY96_00082 [Bacillus thermotolerans]